jgi:hypothetical protein
MLLLNDRESSGSEIDVKPGVKQMRYTQPSGMRQLKICVVRLV